MKLSSVNVSIFSCCEKDSKKDTETWRDYIIRKMNKIENKYIFSVDDELTMFKMYEDIKQLKNECIANGEDDTFNELMENREH